MAEVAEVLSRYGVEPFVAHDSIEPSAEWAAVIEAAILVSRLHMLPRDKIEREMAYLQIAVSKTAGPREQEAWGWLTERVAAFYRDATAESAR